MEIINKDNFHFLKTSKYKKALIKVSFPFNWGDIDINAFRLLGMLLTNANKEYNSIAAMTQYESDLYGSNIVCNDKIYGKTYVVSFSVTYLPERYTEEGNTAKVVKLLSDILYKPFMKNGKFDTGYFKLLKDRIVNEATETLQEKEQIAFSEYAKMFEGSPFQKHKLIDVKALKKLKQEDVLKAYDQLMKSVPTVFVGGDEDESIIELLKENFRFDGKEGKFDYTDSLEKEIKPIVKKDKRFAQSFLIMNFKTGVFIADEDYERMILLSEYLNDRLFKSVREQHGLCYMVACRPVSFYGVCEVFSGIEAKNYRKAVRLINKEFEKIRLGKIVKKEFKMTKEALLGSLRGSEDSLELQVERLSQYLYRGKYIPIDEVINKIKEYDENDIVKVGKNITPLTSFFLKGVGTNE